MENRVFRHSSMNTLDELLEQDHACHCACSSHGNYSMQDAYAGVPYVRDWCDKDEGSTS